MAVNWVITWGNSGHGGATFKTTYTFSCPKGTKAFSAGGRINAPDGTVGLTLIRPDGNLTIGRAGARVGHAGYADSWSVDSAAICAEPAPGMYSRSALTWNPDEDYQCGDGHHVVGAGGGGGLVDLGPYYLTGLSPTIDQGAEWVHMTGVGGRPGHPDEGGMVVQLTCAD